MNSEEIRTILAELKAGTLKIEDAEADILALLRRAPFEDLGFAKVDHHRVIRQGLPEVIFGSGKTPEQIAAIAERLVAHNTTRQACQDNDKRQRYYRDCHSWNFRPSSGRRSPSYCRNSWK